MTKDISSMSDKEFKFFVCLESERIIKDITTQIMSDKLTCLDKLKAEIETGVKASFFKIKHLYGDEYKKRMGRNFPDDLETQKELSNHLLLGTLNEMMAAGDFSFLSLGNKGKR
jgi:hypothetical protein